MAGKYGVRLRQSYLRIAKRAAMMASRYAHAKQFKRHHRQLRLLRSRLGRIIRDIRRKIARRPELAAVFEGPLARAAQIRSAAAAPARMEALFLPRPRGRMHRQGQGSRTLRVRRQSLDRHHQRLCPPVGRFVLHAKAPPGNPYDGHTLGSVIDATGSSPAARSSASMSTRAIGATTQPIRVASSSPVRSAASSASISANCGVAQQSSP